MAVPDTLENRISPDGRARFVGFLVSLGKRTGQSLKVLHIARTPAGFISCDLNLSAATLPDLGGELSRVLSRLNATDAVPVGPQSNWWDFWRGDWIGRGAAYFPKAPRDRYIVMIRGEVQPEDKGILPGWVMIGEPK